MKIVHLNHSDISGGAARAVYRLHSSLLSANIDSEMWVNISISGDFAVRGPATKFEKVISRVRPYIGAAFMSLLNTKNPILHSPAFVPSKWTRRINSSNVDLINLHWINSEMMSIANIARIRKPIVWTLHDMWAFSGAEHYSDEFRWRDGYYKNNRPTHESGFDLNRLVWSRKIRQWKKPIHIVAPSSWLAQCAAQSSLMRDWPIRVIPNPLDTDLWKPVHRSVARELLRLPSDVPLVLFGALGGGNDPRKGFDLLCEALKVLKLKEPDIHLVVFGQHAPRDPIDMGFPTHYLGHLNDDISLRLAYSAADVMVVPSRQEAFGQTASEAHSCGTPVVAFNVGGLSDIVDHKVTGYLASAYDPDDLAFGIEWVLKSSSDLRLGDRSRDRAVAYFDKRVVAEKYIDLYREVLTSAVD